MIELHMSKYIPNHKKCNLTTLECESEPAALCMSCIFEKQKRVNWLQEKRLRSGLSDQPPSESHSQLFQVRGKSAPQGRLLLRCKAHQKTNSFSADFKWGLGGEKKRSLLQTTEIRSAHYKHMKRSGICQHNPPYPPSILKVNENLSKTLILVKITYC